MYIKYNDMKNICNKVYDELKDYLSTTLSYKDIFTLDIEMDYEDVIYEYIDKKLSSYLDDNEYIDSHILQARNEIMDYLCKTYDFDEMKEELRSNLKEFKNEYEEYVFLTKADYALDYY